MTGPVNSSKCTRILRSAHVGSELRLMSCCLQAEAARKAKLEKDKDAKKKNEPVSAGRLRRQALVQTVDLQKMRTFHADVLPKARTSTLCICH